ncbi:MAG: hypothetical protein U1E27_00975 [Kiritimatiellia bacterium]|nr:hypothetical protein [Kiritimatiellia bacterium]
MRLHPPAFHKRLLRWILPFLGLALLMSAGIGTRRTLLRAQPRGGSILPFTLESALHYRRIREVFLSGTLAANDPMIQVPEGIRTFETDTVGSEFVVAKLARGFPDLMTLPERVRWIHVTWFCLGIPWLALWIRWRTRSWLGAWIGGGFYAISFGSVVRSTGLELSHETIALPFLIAHLALEALADQGERGRRSIPARTGSILALALALMTWDMVQFYIGLRALCFLWSAARRIPQDGSSAAALWAPEALALLVVGLAHPYFRSHQFVFSPVMGFYAATAVLVGLRAGPLRDRYPRLMIATLGVGLAMLPARLSGYSEQYGHFGRLLMAKLRFLNMKPMNPELLDFEQRIMWTPALHSATPSLVFQLFPFLLVLTFAAFAVWYLDNTPNADRKFEKESAKAWDGRLFFWICSSFFAFLFFVRFQVYVALFFSAGIGMAASSLLRIRGIRRWGIAGVLIFGLLGEAVLTLKRTQSWGRDAAYDDLAELTAWIKGTAEGEPVLANFGVSAYLLTYANTPVILHPKFENSAIRNRVEQYGSLLFKGTEDAFADWAEQLGARYYVYSMGEFSTVRPEYQMRYMVNALNPPLWSPARRFEWMPQNFRRFAYLWGNARYRVYRIRPPGEELQRGSD